ncbi:MAG: hypothetical protein IJE10_04225 [Clostridia bacterium]|nr:hypothetical protein [Clostridia bacterium]
MKKCLGMFLVFCMLLALSPTSSVVSAQQPIRVYVNGEKIEFDVDPVLINDRTMVPMRKIFETLGAVVSWNGDSETASGVRNGVRVSVSIDSPIAKVGRDMKKLDQPPVLLDGRTLIPLRFISESFGAEVEWVDETQTVYITLKDSDEGTIYFPAKIFSDLGSWSVESDCLFGSTGSKDDETGSVPGTAPAITEFEIKSDGKYNVWVLARDFATNRQGHRYYNVGIDNEMSDIRVGTHGKDGFHWQLGGTFDLKSGVHQLKLHDTSGYWARCQAVMLVKNPDFVPNVDEITDYALKYAVNEGQNLPACVYPYWATQPMTEFETVTLENDTYKVHFIKGQSAKGQLIQNEIFVKKNGEWIQIKDKTEQFGVLMMQADSSVTGTPRTKGMTITSNLEGEFFNQTVTVNGEQKQFIATDFYETGIPYWFLADDMLKISDTEIKLFFPTKAGATLSAVCSLDALCDEPKFTLNAKFDVDGAYSFLFFSGDAIDESKFERVMAPFMFTRSYVPLSGVFSEPYMFTPMVSYVTKTDDGGTLTSGVVVDPVSTKQDVAYTESARYGFVLRDENAKMRPALCAPMFGTPGSNFKAGDTYSFAYRVFAGLDGWYETFKHISQDIYEVKDIRTNYYSTLNEAVYNITDLLADDLYGGWDDKTMGFYYAETDNTASQCNPLEIVQRYLLSEDESFYEERVVPSVAFLLTRQGNHFNRNLNDTSVMGTQKLGMAPSISGGAMYTSLYQMSQGRMPYLLGTALGKNNMSGLAGVATQESFYQITGDEKYKKNVMTVADEIIASYDSDAFKQADALLRNSAFVSGDFNTQLYALIYAYELTGDKKYLDAAEEVGRNAALTLSSQGFQNGYAHNTYHVDPQTAADAHVIWADNVAGWWWRGDIQWRIGFPHGTWGPLEGTVSTIHEEDAPGWLFATAGLTTEHARTAGHSNFILMETWAPAFLKLGMYTGDDYFTTQARNALVGRFSNYPGYYVDRYYTNYMKNEYPYEGPEYNMFYYTHVAPFAAMAEDFLITEFKTRSNGKISFPELHFDGYSYFTASQYGARPGKMYDVDGLWLWNTKGILTTSDVNVNFLAGRKDGTLALALMNQSQETVTTEITLGEKVPNFTGEATLYALDGSQSSVQVTDGRFSLTIPGRGIQTVVLKIDGIQKPSYALDEIKYTTEYEKTVSAHKNGRGYVIQFNPDKYHAYIYVTDNNLKSLKIDYEVDGKKESRVIESYPFETIIRVDSSTEEISYSVTATLADGSVADYGNGVLAPMSDGPQETNLKNFVPGESGFTASGVNLSTLQVSSKVPANFDKCVVEVSRIGLGPDALRVVIPTGKLSIPDENNAYTGLYVRGVLQMKNGTGVFQFDSRVMSNEIIGTENIMNVLSNANMHLENKPENMNLVYYEISKKPFTDEIPMDEIQLEIEKENEKAELPDGLEQLKLNVDYIGVGPGVLRVVAKTDGMGFDVQQDMFKKLKAKVSLKQKSGDGTLNFDGVVVGNEMRAGATVVLVAIDGLPVGVADNYDLTECVLYTETK